VRPLVATALFVVVAACSSLDRQYDERLASTHGIVVVVADYRLLWKSYFEEDPPAQALLAEQHRIATDLESALMAQLQEDTGAPVACVSLGASENDARDLARRAGTELVLLCWAESKHYDGKKGLMNAINISVATALVTAALLSGSSGGQVDGFPTSDHGWIEAKLVDLRDQRVLWTGKVETVVHDPNAMRRALAELLEPFREHHRD